jgi:hypothetical protein
MVEYFHTTPLDGFAGQKRPSSFGVTNKNVSAIVSWKTATDKDEIERVVNADDMQVFRCDSFT